MNNGSEVSGLSIGGNGESSTEMRDLEGNGGSGIPSWISGSSLRDACETAKRRCQRGSRIHEIGAQRPMALNLNVCLIRVFRDPKRRA